MSRVQDDIAVFGGTIIPVGLSQVIRVDSSQYQISSVLKVASGGSLEIVTPQWSGSSTGASIAPAWGKGYLIGSNEVISWEGQSSIYLCATGATSVAHMLCGYAYGASTP